MRRVGLILVLASTACSTPNRELVLLTRDGCVEANQMRQHLDAAIVKTGWAGDYQVVNLEALATDDPNIGYPTPTVLYEGRDLYGMETPTPPLPEPT